MAKWSGSPEQQAFLKRALEEHIAASTRRRGAPNPDLRSDQLAKVAGTEYRARPETVAALEGLLDAARKDLQKAKIAGDPDALKTTSLAITSAYRDSGRQETLWKEYFPGYYNATAKSWSEKGSE
jgi:hypothetical protein